MVKLVHGVRGAFFTRHSAAARSRSANNTATLASLGRFEFRASHHRGRDGAEDRVLPAGSSRLNSRSPAKQRRNSACNQSRPDRSNRRLPVVLHKTQLPRDTVSCPQPPRENQSLACMARPSWTWAFSKYRLAAFARPLVEQIQILPGGRRFVPGLIRSARAQSEAARNVGRIARAPKLFMRRSLPVRLVVPQPESARSARTVANCLLPDSNFPPKKALTPDAEVPMPVAGYDDRRQTSQPSHWMRAACTPGRCAAVYLRGHGQDVILLSPGCFICPSGQAIYPISSCWRPLVSVTCFFSPQACGNGSWRLVALLIGLLLFGDAVHYRFFNELISAHELAYAGQVKDVWGSVVPLLRWNRSRLRLRHSVVDHRAGLSVLAGATSHWPPGTMGLCKYKPVLPWLLLGST